MITGLVQGVFLCTALLSNRSEIGSYYEVGCLCKEKGKPSLCAFEDVIPADNELIGVEFVAPEQLKVHGAFWKIYYGERK